MIQLRKIKKEQPEICCKSLALLMKENNDPYIRNMLINDFAYKFPKIVPSDEKKQIAFEGLEPFVPPVLLDLFTCVRQGEPVNNKKKAFDILILTVVANEFIVGKKAFALPEKDNPDLKINHMQFWETEFKSSINEKTLSCLVSMIGSAGNVKAALAAASAFNRYNFDLAILVGIAAGYKKKTKFADVIIANQVMDYESNRVEKDGMKQRPKCHSVDPGLEKQIGYFIASNLENTDNFSNIYNNLISEYDIPKYPEERVPEISQAVILAGDKLLADKITINKLVTTYHEQARAFEMESNGFVTACVENHVPWLVFRGISDFGDSGKSKLKDYQQNAALSAICACKLFLENGYSCVKDVEF